MESGSMTLEALLNFYATKQSWRGSGFDFVS